MTNAKNKRSWDSIWERLQQTSGFSGIENPLLNQNATISDPTTIYVDTTGNDNNEGTQGSPFLTIQAALDYVSQFQIGAPVTVQVGAGTFAGFIFPTLRILPNVTLTAGQVTAGQVPGVTVKGTWAAVTPATGSASGTATSVTTVLLTHTGQTWTVDNLKGKFVAINVATGVRYIPITGNTATTLTLPAQTNSTSNLLYSIVVPATIITQTAVSPISGSICVSAGTITGIGTPCTVEGVQFNGTTSSGTTVRTYNHAVLGLRSCYWNLTASNSNGVGIGGNSVALINNCYAAFTNANGNFVFASLGTQNTAAFNGQGVVGVGATYVKGAGTGGGVAINATAGSSAGFVVQAAGLTVENIGTGISIGSAFASSVSLGSLIATTVGTVATVTGKQNNISIPVATSGSGCTNAFVANKGASIQLASAVTAFGATNEITIDGTVSTLAAMRALSPKATPATPNAYGTVVYE